MNTKLYFLILGLSFNFSLLLGQTFNYEKAWEKVSAEENQGLPISALKIADSIYFEAKNKQNYPQFIKAFIYKMKYRSIIDWSEFAINLQVAEKMTDSVSFPVKPILHSMLGEMYWWYYQNNRYTFYNRSRTTEFVPNDIKTWDLNRIVAKVIEHYKLSLNESDKLKMIDLVNYKDILFYQRNSETDDNPTLYDFLALRAIDFFKGEEPGLTRPAEEFSMNNDDFFLPADTFSKIKILTSDSMAFKYYALIMLQDLIKFHLNDSLPGTLVDIDLKRLEFVNQQSNSNNKDNLYLKSLYFLETKSDEFDCDAKVGLTIAEKMYNIGNKYNPRVSETYKWEKKKALEKCMALELKYPKASYLCGNFKAKVQSKTIELTIEKENLPDEPFRILVAYQNTDSLYVKVVQTSYNEYDDIIKEYQEQNKEKYIEWDSYIIDCFKKKKSKNQFMVSLPNDQDFQKHYTEIKIPALQKGLYFILAGIRADMDYKKQAVNYGLTAVTNISYISRRNSDGSNDFYLLNRKTGFPLENVQAKCWTNIYNYTSRQNESLLETEYSSDADGFIHMPTTILNNKNFWVDFSHQDDEWSSRNLDQLNPYGQFYSYPQRDNIEKDTRTFFFTDRSIYRPGQTIYFKGIVLETDGHKNNKILTSEPVTVALYNVNNQKVSEIKLISNEFGSFSGSFTAPTNGLNGLMTIEDDNDGSISISVEDYKRPKFEVKYDTMKNSYKLGQMVKVQGHAVAYSGVNIDNASVKYRVVRQIRFDWWWDTWWNPRPVSSDKEITNGTTTTGKNGEFEVNFKAIPDESVSPSSNPTFTYVVYTDVTDINGETHSAEKRVGAGYKALIVKPEIPYNIEKSNSTEFKITTCNQNGDFVSASGNIVIYKLKDPDRIYRDRRWPKPDRHALSRDEYNHAFPYDQYDDELNPLTWDTEKTILETTFNTGTAKTIKFPDLKRWKTGMYKFMIESKDVYGDTIKQTVFFNLFDKESKTLPYPMANWFYPTKEVCEPDEKAEMVAGSGYSDGSRVLFEVESERKIVYREWVSLKNEQRIFTHRIKEEYRGNIGVHYTFVKNNRLYTNDIPVYVPYTNKTLDINFETFRNKLQPGEKDTWRLRIKGKNGELSASEMVASLYDASLDAFKPQSFNFNIWPYYYPYMAWESQNSFGSDILKNYTNKRSDYNTVFGSNQYSLNWFGFGYRVIYNPSGNKGNWIAKSGKSTFKIISSVKQKGTEVSGIIYDDSNQEPLIGANIVIEGSNSGTITDINGQFHISSISDDINLLFSFVGYASEKINLKQKGKVKLLVNLAAEIQALNEVVVVGYGVQKKTEVTGSVITIRGVASASASVQGSMAGVNVTKTQKSLENEKLPDLSKVQARTNLNETAFFFPHLQTDENGDVLINFTIPEALTRWKMLGFAHTKDLKYGFTENELVTQKDLMVTPNAPRFFRENDTMTFTAKITSLSDKDLTGSAQLMLFDALTMKPADVQMHNKNAQQNFSIKKGESSNMNWDIIVPSGLQAVTYRVVAQAGKFSDGEESSLPVLTNSMLVTETLPLPVKGRQTKTYTLDKLVHNTSTTLRNHKLTLEFTSNPAWYAIQALPYLMEYPYECAEQTFSRFYANSIASHIANASPRIKQVFDSWKNVTPEALLSNLEKNQELKSLTLEETPWVMDAKDESERKRRVALLFDLNRMSNELGRALDKLQKMQVSNGGFPWFQGMPDDRYITQHIVCGMGKLDHLGVTEIRKDSKIWQMVNRAITYTDERITEEYQELKRLEKAGKLVLSDNHTGYTQIHYLYARSFFNDVSMNGNAKEALDYYLEQVRKYWLKNNFYMQGMISIALNRYNDVKTPASIIKSFREHAINSEEMGMYWKNDNGWFWYQAPTETQALMIEAFDEVAHDTASVNEMKVWLLKQKQTQDWKTTKATAEACYALLLRGTEWLSNDELVDITVGNQKVDPGKMPEVKVEAGTGYFKTSWTGQDIKPEMGKVTITKKDNGVSWGALYWQYFEQLDKITSAETPLKLKKQLFIERNTSSGPVIQLISDTTHLKPGDLIKVRIELRVDREMEYVHMKDMRAAGLEPINVLSRYKYQDGLGYYESTRDAATNFFFGWLPKGTYVFEYPLRVTHYGNFSNGITTIQSMYAPEFTSHSEGVRLKVK